MNKIARQTITCLIVFSLAAGLCGCKGDNGASESGKTAISNSGSSTMVNLAQKWAEEYHKVTPDVLVEVGGSGSGVGIHDLTEGRVDIANASRDITDSETQQARRNTGKTPLEWTVGYDAMAIYVHKDNPVEELTIEQLARIYVKAGDIDKWSQLGVKIQGPDEIVRVSRHNTSGTYVFFKEHVLDHRDFKHGSRDVSGCKEVVELVGRTPGAIGYSGMGFKTDAVKFVKVKKTSDDNGYFPTLENFVSGRYSLGRSLHMYTLGPPIGSVKDYIDWILSPAGQEIVEAEGYIPVAPAGQDQVFFRLDDPAQPDA